MFLVRRVDFVAPLPRPLIQILPTGEGAAREEVSFDEAEGPLYAPRAVRVADRMRYELEAEPLAEGSHLRHRNHVAPAAPQHHHVRVIDHHALPRATHVTQRFGQKNLAVEALECRITLEEQHPRVTQHGRRGLHSPLLSRQFDVVRRGVVLYLLARSKLI